MIIKILGSGCANCKRLEESTKKAVEELGFDAHIEKVTQWSDIMAFGITATPGFVVDGQVKSFGRVLSTQEIKNLLSTPGNTDFSLKI